MMNVKGKGLYGGTDFRMVFREGRELTNMPGHVPILIIFSRENTLSFIVKLRGTWFQLTLKSHS